MEDGEEEEQGELEGEGKGGGGSRWGRGRGRGVRGGEERVLPDILQYSVPVPWSQCPV